MSTIYPPFTLSTLPHPPLVFTTLLSIPMGYAYMRILCILWLISSCSPHSPPLCQSILHLRLLALVQLSCLLAPQHEEHNLLLVLFTHFIKGLEQSLFPSLGY